MSLSLFNMIDNAKRKNTFGLMDMFEGVKDTIFPIIQNTPYGWAYDKTKEHGMNFTRELGEGAFHDLPQGVIDLGTDIINRGSNLIGREGDLINRESVQVVPPVYDAGEREQIGMKSLEEDSIGRILGQLLGGYAGIRGVLSKGLMSEAVAVAGAGSTLDPTKDNLSNFMQDTRFNNALFEYMSAGVPEEAGAEERLLARVGNMTEELGLAFIPLGLIHGIRTMKNNPAIKEQILDTFHPDRVGGLLSDKTGLTTDYRMFAHYQSPNEMLTNPKIDQAGFYLKSEQQIMAMPQNEMPVSQVEGFLKKRGVSPSEMEDLGLLDMLNKRLEVYGQATKITKQGLLDYIDSNRIEMSGESLKIGGGESAFDSLAAPNPNDYYQSENAFRYENARAGVDTDVQGIDWETGKWYSGDGENQWRIMDNEHHDMRIDELWEDLKGEINTLQSDNAFQAGYSMEMFNSLQTFEELHKLYPDKYPETTVMRMDKLREAIKSREQFIDRNQSNAGYAQTHNVDDGTSTGTMTTLQVARREMAKATEELQELESNFKWGSEWDADIMRGLQDDTLDDLMMIDMEEAVNIRATNEYMDSPYFEVRVGDDELGHYIFRGSDDIEWTIHDETGDNIFKDDSPSMRSSPSLAEAQVELRQYVENQGLSDDLISVGEAKYTNPDWIQPNADMKTYSEELVRYNIYDEDVYELGHYGADYPNTVGHLRKTIRTGTVVQPDITVPRERKGTYTDLEGATTEYTTGELRKGREVGLFEDDNNVYMVEEIQRDWAQSGREFGFGEDEQARLYALSETKVKELGELQRTLSSYLTDMRDFMTSGLTTDATGKRQFLNNVDRQMELNLLPNDTRPLSIVGKRYEDQQKFLEMVPNKLLQKSFQLGDRQGHRMSNAPLEELGFDPDKYSRKIQPSEVRTDKEWNEMWKVDPRNPDSENFKGFGLADLDELNTYILDEFKLEDRWQKQQPYEQVPEFTPLRKQDRDVHLIVKHAITKALENGSNKVAFPTGDMILDVWNRSRSTVEHGKVRFEELYRNLYDKTIPKFIKKYAGQHQGKVGKMYIDDFQREVFYIEITPEMKKSLRKEVKLPYQTTKNIEDKGIMTPQSLYAKFPLPIGAGLLGMQDEKNESGLLN